MNYDNITISQSKSSKGSGFASYSEAIETEFECWSNLVNERGPAVRNVLTGKPQVRARPRESQVSGISNQRAIRPRFVKLGSYLLLAFVSKRARRNSVTRTVGYDITTDGGRMGQDCPF